MIIGFVIDDTLDSSDGVQQYVLSLGAWFSTQGHEVHYVAGQTTRSDVKNIHSLARNLKVKFNHNTMSMPLLTRKSAIKKVLSDVQFDVLHVQMPYSPLMAGRVVKYASPSTAVVGTFHILPFSWLERSATKLLGTLLRANLRRFQAFIAVSEPAKFFAGQSFRITAQDVPNPVNTALFKSNESIESNGQVKITYVGRLVPRKGALELMKAFGKLINDQPGLDVYLTICGTGELRSKLEAIIHEQKIENYVTLLGFVDEATKVHELQTADIAVFPSIGGESFGIVLTEAMAAGAGVVIGGDNPGYRSVLDDDAVLFNPQDIDEFAGLLQNLIQDPVLRVKLHKKQAKQISRYDIDIVGRQVLDVYRSAIAKVTVTRNNRKQ